MEVKDDFGNFGFDKMTGDSVPAGQTANFKMAISMSKGALHDIHGEVSEC